MTSPYQASGVQQEKNPSVCGNSTEGLQNHSRLLDPFQGFCISLIIMDACSKQIIRKMFITLKTMEADSYQPTVNAGSK